MMTATAKVATAAATTTTMTIPTTATMTTKTATSPTTTMTTTTTMTRIDATTIRNARESSKATSRRGARRCDGVSGRLNIAKSIQRLHPPVLRHQAEVQITICAKPGVRLAHSGRTPGVRLAHSGRTPGVRQAYARRKKKLKSL